MDCKPEDRFSSCRPFCSTWPGRSCLQAVKALARLCICIGLPEPLLVVYTISTKISYDGS